MHVFRKLKHSGLHRQAASALYRELLTSCLAVPLPSESQHKLQDIVRNRFYAHRFEQNRQKVKLAFHAGYTALDLLDEAGLGNDASLARVQDYLDRVPKNVTSAPKKRTSVPSKQKGPETFETPTEHKFLNAFPRPIRLPTPEDITAEVLVQPPLRRVPYLVNAQHLPFVRFKKPQPANVSRVLRQRKNWIDRQIARTQSLKDFHLPLAEYEDRWEGIVRGQFRRRGTSAPDCLGDEPEESYAHYVEIAKEEEEKVRRADVLKRIELADRMQDIVEKEEQYAVLEKLAWKEVRQKRWEASQKANESD